MIQLIPIKKVRDHARILYDLLLEREDYMNISHKKMPTFTEHEAFIESDPYFQWFLIKSAINIYVGSIYLTSSREVGLFIFKRHQSEGYGKAALVELKKRVGGKLLANINPANQKSIRFFEKLGARLIQHTYEIT